MVVDSHVVVNIRVNLQEISVCQCSVLISNKGEFFCVQVFVELNELVIDRNQELQWRETARWIKFEEEVEEETERWGRPHIPSLSFRSLLELRKTISHGEEEQGALCCPSLDKY